MARRLEERKAVEGKLSVLSLSKWKSTLKHNWIRLRDQFLKCLCNFILNHFMLDWRFKDTREYIWRQLAPSDDRHYLRGTP